MKVRYFSPDLYIHWVSLGAIYAGLENGTLRPAVAQEFALSEVAKSHETVRVASSSGKVVLRF